MVGLEALGGDGFEFRGEGGEREQQARRHLLGPACERDGAGVKDGGAGSGVDIDAHFGGIFQQALGVFEGFDEEGGDSEAFGVGVVGGFGHDVGAPSREATVYLALVPARQTWSRRRGFLDLVNGALSVVLSGTCAIGFQQEFSSKNLWSAA
jgi:hypothetical protein